MDNPPYTFVDHIVGTGNNSRIDSGVVGNDNTLKFDVCFSVDTYTQYNALFGNYVNEDTNCWRLIQGGTDNGSIIFSSNNRAGTSYTVHIFSDSIVNKKIHLIISKQRLEYGIAGEELKVATRATVTEGTENDITIAISSNRPLGGGNAGGMKKTWYWFKIYQGDTIIRDYRPCRRNSDGKYGFFETLSKTFYPSIGTVDFSAN